MYFKHKWVRAAVLFESQCGLSASASAVANIALQRATVGNAGTAMLGAAARVIFGSNGRAIAVGHLVGKNRTKNRNQGMQCHPMQVPSQTNDTANGGTEVGGGLPVVDRRQCSTVGRTNLHVGGYRGPILSMMRGH